MSHQLPYIKALLRSGDGLHTDARERVGNPLDLDVAATDLLVFPLLNPGLCRLLVELAEDFDLWKQMPGDAYPGHEVRLATIDHELDRVFNQVFAASVNAVISQRYRQYRVHPLQVEAFIIRYQAGKGLQGMKPHYDGHSDLSFSVPLNQEWEGEGLGFTNLHQHRLLESLVPHRRLPVGNALCFPGGPAAEHYFAGIKSGTRYSLTVWTRG